MATKTKVSKVKSALRDFEASAPYAVKLSPPWYGWANEVKAIFADDADISVGELEESDGAGVYVLSIDAKTESKANALKIMLPIVKNFGNINVDIEITLNGTPLDFIGERTSIPDTINWINKLFEGTEVEGQCYEMFGGYIGFVVCPATIVQFYNDNITDINGNATMLFADAAKDVIDVPTGVNFCTAAIR